MTRLHAQVQALPGVPSPLERADDLFDKGQFSDALALFQGQAQAATNPQIQQEARCKAGLCLLQLNRADQAAELFAPLLNEPGERWPPVAAGQLLLIRLQQNRFDDMDALLANIRNRFRFEQLAGHIPDHLRKGILDSLSVTAHEFLLPEPGQLHKLEQCIALAQVFQENHAIVWAKHNLARMQFLLGNEKDALATAKEILPDPDALDPNVLGHIYRVRVACWLMRRHGETRAALDYLDRLLFAAPGVYRQIAPAPQGLPNGPTIPSVISPCSPTGPASTSRWAISSRPRRTSTTSFVSSPPTTPNTASTPRPTSSRASCSRRKATPMPPARPGRTASTRASAPSSPPTCGSTSRKCPTATASSCT